MMRGAIALEFFSASAKHSGRDRPRAFMVGLILGEGDGRFLAQLLEYNRHATIAVVETSTQMIRLARQRVPRAGVRAVAPADGVAMGRLQGGAAALHPARPHHGTLRGAAAGLRRNTLQ